MNRQKCIKMSENKGIYKNEIVCARARPSMNEIGAIKKSRRALEKQNVPEQGRERRRKLLTQMMVLTSPDQSSLMFSGLRTLNAGESWVLSGSVAQQDITEGVLSCARAYSSKIHNLSEFLLLYFPKPDSTSDMTYFPKDKDQAYSQNARSVPSAT